MKNLIKNIGTSLIGGLFLVLISDYLKSDFLIKFLENNLLMLLIALLAINITTISIILTRIGDIGGDFPRTIKEMKWSIIEQIVIIFIGLIAQILGGSSQLKNLEFYSYISLLLLTIPASVLIYAVIILWDTSQAVFILLTVGKR